MCLALTKLNANLHFYHTCHSSLSVVISVSLRDFRWLVWLHGNTLINEKLAEISISDFRSACDPFFLHRPQRCWVCVLHLCVLWKVGVVGSEEAFVLDSWPCVCAGQIRLLALLLLEEFCEITHRLTESDLCVFMTAVLTAHNPPMPRYVSHFLNWITADWFISSYHECCVTVREPWMCSDATFVQEETHLNPF